MTALLPNTKLKDRTLWYDGDSSYEPERLLKLIQIHDIKYVDFINDIVGQYNEYCSKNRELVVKETCRPLCFEWNIPQQYKTLDVVKYVADKHLEFAKEMSDAQFLYREERLATELQKFKDRELFDVLRTIIYVINTLTENNIVWGVGRGSSVSSYVLYVIGVHDVDSYGYNLNIDDFLHD